MTPIRFTVHGVPVAQPRVKARATLIGGVAQARVHTPSTADDWKRLVMIAAQRHMPAEPIDEAVAVTLRFWFPRPMAHFGTGKYAGQLKQHAPVVHTSRPDVDNLAKAVLDALVSCTLLVRDERVAVLTVRKLYCDPGQRPGCEIVIRYLEE